MKWFEERGTEAETSAPRRSIGGVGARREAEGRAATAYLLALALPRAHSTLTESLAF
jgi:hypothetical protein